MDVKQCYAEMGGDYDDVMSRLRTDERIKKFLLKVADDGSYDLLISSLADRNTEEAFRAAHTLKGISLNLSITRLYEAASAVTEALRGKTDYDPAVEPLVQTLKKVYGKTVECIRAIE